MRPEDAESVANLSGQLGYPSTAENIRARLASIERSGEARALVAETANHHIVGWIHIHAAYLLECDPYAEIGGLVVADAARDAGVGRRLVEAGEKWAGEHGYATMRVRSNVVRLQAHGFYEHLGYARVKTQHNFAKELASSGNTL